MVDLLDSDITAPLTLCLFDLALKGSLLVICAVGVTLLLRRAAAAVRSLVWNAVITALLILPLLALAGPSLKVPLLPDFITAGDATPAGATVLPAARTVDPPALDETITPAADYPDANRKDRLVLPRLPWVTWAALLWVAGLSLLALRYAAGRWMLARLCTSCRACTRAEITGLLARTAHRIGITGPVEIGLSARAPVAFTRGVRRPQIVLPAGAGEWDKGALRCVLVHELTHIRRRDALFETLSQVVLTLFWFNPAVWFAAGRLRIERERTCDDAVLADGSRPSEYAGQLLALAGTPGVLRNPLQAGAALSQGGSLKDRLLFILDPDRRRSEPGRLATPAVIVACACLSLPLGLIVPWKSDPSALQQYTAQLGRSPELEAGLADDLSDARSPDPAVRAAAARAMAADRSRRSREILARLVTDPEPTVRHEAVRALGRRAEAGTVPLLFTVVLEDHVPAVLAEAVEWLVECYAGPQTVLRDAFRAELDRVGWKGGWFAVMKALSQAGDETRMDLGRRIAQTLAGEPEDEFRMAGAEAVASLPDKALIEANLILIGDEFVKIRAVAAHALGAIGEPVKDVQSALNATARKDPHPYARIAAVEALGMLGTPNALYLCDLVGREDTDTDVRQAARRVAEEIRNSNKEK